MSKWPKKDYGPGDPETWHEYSGHPNDPRKPEEPEDDSAYSNCCGEPDRPTGIDGPSYSDIGICPRCREHCDFFRYEDKIPWEDDLFIAGDD